jgi:hypothetical protein
MDPTKAIGQLSRILHKKISESSPKLAQKQKTDASSIRSSLSGESMSIAELKNKIAKRIKELSTDERSGKKGAQVFVEAILIREFGDNILQDPMFTELSKDVVDTMAENETLWNKMQAMLKEVQR